MSYVTLNTTKNNIGVNTTKYEVTLSSVSIPGTPGSQWFTGEGLPDDLLGINGDYYIDTVTNDVFRKILGYYEKVYAFTNLINDTSTDVNHTWSAQKLNSVNNRLIELEQTTFKGDVTPSTGVNQGDTWYDTLNDVFYVYREYPVGSASFRWEPLIFKYDDTIDGGAF